MVVCGRALDVLKIAKELVDGVARDEEDATFVRLIVELAAQRGLRVIAEGIETSEQYEVLKRLGCDLGQGYLFDRPLDGSDAKLTARSAAPAAVK